MMRWWHFGDWDIGNGNLGSDGLFSMCVVVENRTSPIITDSISICGSQSENVTRTRLKKGYLGYLGCHWDWGRRPQEQIKIYGKPITANCISKWIDWDHDLLIRNLQLSLIS